MKERKHIFIDRDRTDEVIETPDRQYWIDKSWGEYEPTGLSGDISKRISKLENNDKR
jgi:hypothetical protein